MPVVAFHLNHIPPRSLEPDESLPDPIELGWLNPDTSVVDTFLSYVVLNLDDRNNDRKLFRAYPAIVYDMVHAGTHRIPPDHRFPTDELLRFTDIANHGSVPALPGMAIIELHGTHTPSSYPPLILICPEGFFQHPSSLSVDTVYNGRGFNIIRSELPLRLTSPDSQDPSSEPPLIITDDHRPPAVRKAYEQLEAHTAMILSQTAPPEAPISSSVPYFSDESCKSRIRNGDLRAYLCRPDAQSTHLIYPTSYILGGQIQADSIIRCTGCFNGTIMPLRILSGSKDPDLVILSCITPSDQEARITTFFRNVYWSMPSLRDRSKHN
ncbi:hypothetical protein C8J57DRAFT_1538982 [Mycena rebaudengoi]|nr:hypothetical protein C8J57DRAFT_1538982 [Mycena rebaudengoi]